MLSLRTRWRRQSLERLLARVGTGLVLLSIHLTHRAGADVLNVTSSRCRAVRQS
jgi:hypothetical protein